MITSNLLGIPSTAFLKTFEIAIQSGAILAVLFLYTSLLWKHKNLILKISVAFLPTAVVGFTLYPLIKSILLDNIFIVFIALIVGGIAILFVEKKNIEQQPRPLESLTYKESFLLGSLQVLALIPGVSRSGATIIGGLAYNYPRTFLIEFSFLLALPTILGATAYDLYKNQASISHDERSLLIVGALVSGIVAYSAMKMILHYLKTNTFIPFGYYRIIIGTLGLLYFLQ